MLSLQGNSVYAERQCNLVDFGLYTQLTAACYRDSLETRYVEYGSDENDRGGGLSPDEAKWRSRVRGGPYTDGVVKVQD